MDEYVEDIDLDSRRKITGHIAREMVEDTLSDLTEMRKVMALRQREDEIHISRAELGEWEDTLTRGVKTLKRLLNMRTE